MEILVVSTQQVLISHLISTGDRGSRSPRDHQVLSEAPSFDSQWLRLRDTRFLSLLPMWPREAQILPLPVETPVLRRR